MPETNIQTTNNTNLRSDIYLGLSIQVAGQIVNIDPKTSINNIKTQGFEGGISKPLELGTVGSMFDTVAKEFGIKSGEGEEDYKWENINKSVEGIPVVTNLIATLGNAYLTIEELSIKTGPTHRLPDNKGGELIAIPEKEQIPTQYSIALSMTWQEGQGKLFGGIELRGLYFKAERK